MKPMVHIVIRAAKFALAILPIILILAAMWPQPAAAGVNDEELKGAVYIEGDVIDVTWDDEGILLSTAEGNVYLRFTSEQGRIFELRGDALTYERVTLGDGFGHRISIEGDAKLDYGGNNLAAGRIEGLLEPLGLTMDKGVELDAEGFDVTSDALTLVEEGGDDADEPLYNANISGDARATFYRTMEETRPEPATVSGTAIPLPVHINPDFEVLTLTADGFDVVFNDDGLVGASFPHGAYGKTDTGYVVTQSALEMSALEEFIATDCNIVGPDVDIDCDVMTFYPDDKLIELAGGVVLKSDEGSLSVDALTVIYDDYGVRELSAQGNVTLDFTLVLFKEQEVEETKAGEASGGDAPE
jgi:hypothetical protein